MDTVHTGRRDSATTVLLMVAAFLVAFALAAIILVVFGVGERGTAIALRATARWSFLLFWCAYAGGAIAWLWPRLNELAQRGRELGSFLRFCTACPRRTRLLDHSRRDWT
jgi:hypothetical protein